MKRFVTVGNRRFKAQATSFRSHWDWGTMLRVPGISQGHTPLAWDRLQSVGLTPDLTFYVDLLQPGSGDGSDDERLTAAGFIRGVADALGLIIVPLGRSVVDAFLATDPRLAGQRLGCTEYGVLPVPNPHNKATAWWTAENVAMLRDEVTRLLRSNDYVGGVEADPVGDAIGGGE